MNFKSRNYKHYIDWDEYFRLKNEEKLTDSKIAKIFMMSESTLIKLKKESKISKRKVVITVDWVRYDYLIKQGLTQTDVAKEMGINPSTLSQKKKQRKVG